MSTLIEDIKKNARDLDFLHSLDTINETAHSNGHDAVKPIIQRNQDLIQKIHDVDFGDATAEQEVDFIRNQLNAYRVQIASAKQQITNYAKALKSNNSPQQLDLKELVLAEGVAYEEFDKLVRGVGGVPPLANFASNQLYSIAFNLHHAFAERKALQTDVKSFVKKQDSAIDSTSIFQIRNNLTNLGKNDLGQDGLAVLDQFRGQLAVFGANNSIDSIAKGFFMRGADIVQHILNSEITFPTTSQTPKPDTPGSEVPAEETEKQSDAGDVLNSRAKIIQDYAYFFRDSAKAIAKIQGFPSDIPTNLVRVNQYTAGILEQTLQETLFTPEANFENFVKSLINWTNERKELHDAILERFKGDSHADTEYRTCLQSLENIKTLVTDLNNYSQTDLAQAISMLEEMSQYRYQATSEPSAESVPVDVLPPEEPGKQQNAPDGAPSRFRDPQVIDAEFEEIKKEAELAPVPEIERPKYPSVKNAEDFARLVQMLSGLPNSPILLSEAKAIETLRIGMKNAEKEIKAIPQDSENAKAQITELFSKLSQVRDNFHTEHQQRIQWFQRFANSLSQFEQDELKRVMHQCKFKGHNLTAIQRTAMRKHDLYDKISVLVDQQVIQLVQILKQASEGKGLDVRAIEKAIAGIENKTKTLEFRWNSFAIALKQMVDAFTSAEKEVVEIEQKEAATTQGLPRIGELITQIHNFYEQILKEDVDKLFVQYKTTNLGETIKLKDAKKIAANCKKQFETLNAALIDIAKELDSTGKELPSHKKGQLTGHLNKVKKWHEFSLKRIAADAKSKNPLCTPEQRTQLTQMFTEVSQILGQF